MEWSWALPLHHKANRKVKGRGVGGSQVIYQKHTVVKMEVFLSRDGHCRARITNGPFDGKITPGEYFFRSCRANEHAPGYFLWDWEMARGREREREAARTISRRMQLLRFFPRFSSGEEVLRIWRCILRSLALAVKLGKVELRSFSKFELLMCSCRDCSESNDCYVLCVMFYSFFSLSGLCLLVNLKAVERKL